MNSQWKLVPVEPTETMVINGFESVPDECFTDEEVWEQYQEMSGCQQAAFRAKLCWAAMIAAAPAPDTHIAVLEESAGVEFGIDRRSVRVSQEAYSIFLAREAAGREKIAALQQSLTVADQQIDDLRAELAAKPKPDPVLCKFYDVADWPGLVHELVGHVAQLQDSAKRNVKPWDDTFPPTLLPAYIERVNADNAMVQQPSPVAVVPDGYCIMPRQLTAENGAKALLLGEFKLLVTMECPECCDLEEPTEGCFICDGEGEYGQKHTIPWDQIKFIYSKAVSGLAVKTDSAQPR